ARSPARDAARARAAGEGGPGLRRVCARATIGAAARRRPRVRPAVAGAVRLRRSQNRARGRARRAQALPAARGGLGAARLVAALAGEAAFRVSALSRQQARLSHARSRLPVGPGAAARIRAGTGRRGARAHGEGAGGAVPVPIYAAREARRLLAGPVRGDEPRVQGVRGPGRLSRTALLEAAVRARRKDAGL